MTKQNPEFAKEMQALFVKSESFSEFPILTSVSSDVSAIRSALEIRATESLKYNFVKVPRLRDQLVIDNLRMENAALNLQEKESDRFYIFCVNAFYQLENIINYYYHVMFPDINDLLTEIERSTSFDPEKYRYKRNGTEKTVVDIPVYYKIIGICNSIFPDNVSLKVTLNNLRKIRNDGEHRCQVLMEKRDASNNLYQFLQTATFNSVRNNTPEETVNKIRGILSGIDILLLERHFINSNRYSCRVCIGNNGLADLNIGTNGKGRSFE